MSVLRTRKSCWIAVSLVVCMITSSFVFLVDASHGLGTDSASADLGAARARVASSLRLDGLPLSVEVGDRLGFTLTVLDRNGGICTNYKGTVGFWSSDAYAIVPSPYTFVRSDNGQHWFNSSLVFNSVGSQILVVSDVKNPEITGSVSIAVVDTRIVLLDERFDSYGFLDPHWTLWNCSNPIYNTVEVSNGTLRMTNIDNPTVDNAYNSMANWTYQMTYDTNLTFSFRVYLPYDDDYKVGYWEQLVAIILYDSSGFQRLVVRFLMDMWTGAPNGFTYVSQDNAWENICGFTQGWHNCSVSLRKGASTWTACFDGVVYRSLTFAGSPWNASDISKLILYNSLREEPVLAMFDDVKVERVGPPLPPPPEPNTPPIADFVVLPSSIGNPDTEFTFNGSLTYDKEDPLSALKFRWDWEGDGFWDTEWSSSPYQSHAYHIGGAFMIVLQVVDTGNLTGMANHTVCVDANPPFCYAGPDIVSYGGSNVMLSAEGSFDAETAIVDYEWRYSDYYGEHIVHSSNVTVSIHYPAQQEVPITLAVTDAGGNKAYDICEVTVWPYRVTVLKYSGHDSKVKTAYGLRAPDNGDWTIFIENYGLKSVEVEVLEIYNDNWTTVFLLQDVVKFQSYNAFPYGTVTLPLLHMKRGLTYQVTVTPSGTAGTYADFGNVFASTNQAPIAQMSVVSNGLTACVDASSSSDPDGDQMRFVWDWGDGGMGYGTTASHVYAGSGTYTVTLKAIDSAGGFACCSQQVSLGGASGWQSPTLLQSVIDYEQMGSVGMDDQGNAVVLWEQPFGWSNYSSEGPSIWSVRYDYISGWGDPVKIWDAQHGYGYTTLGVGPNGEAVAAWLAGSYPSVSIYARLFNPISGWGETSVLGTGTNYGNIVAAVDRNGGAMVVVEGQPSLSLTAWRHDAVSGWQSEVIVTGGGAWPRLRYDASGCALLVWNDFDSYQVKSSRYVPGYGWGPVMVASGSIGGYWVEMDVDDSGRGLAAFFIHNGTAWDMYGNLFDPLTGWGIPTHIGPVAGGWHPFGGFVAAGALGEFFVVWEQTDSYEYGNRTVWARTWTEWGGWSAPVKLNSGVSTNDQMFTSIAANGRGEALASWTEGDTTMEDVVAARYTPGMGWGTPEVIDSSETYRAYLSSIAMAPNGDAVAIWRQSDGDFDLLWGRIFLASSGPPPNLPPVAVIDIESTVGLTVYVDGVHSYDSDGYIVWYSWSWGDGSPPTPPSWVPTASHTYASAGKYAIRLQVFDNLGESTVGYDNVTVYSPPQPGNWTTPVSIGTGAAVALYGGVSMDSNANGYAVASWVEVGTNQWEVYANLYVPGIGWQGAEYLGSVVEYSYFTCAGIDGAGDATVAWVTGHTTLCCKRYASSAHSWEPVVEIVKNAYYIEGLTLAVEVNGKAVMAWCSQEGSRWDIYASIRSTGNRWSSPVHIESSPGSAYNPSAAISEGGDAIVAFTVWGYTGGDVYASYYDAAYDTWYPEQLLENVTGDAKCLRASMDDYHNAFVVWDQWLNGLDTVYVNVLRRGWGWGVADRIEPSTGYSITNPEVSAYGNCNAVVSWVLTSANSTDIRICRYLNGSTWSAPVTIASNCPNAWHTSVSADSLGNTFLTWSQSDGSGNPSGYFVETTRWDSMHGWSAPSVVSWVTNTSGPRIAASQVGTAILVWDDFGAVANVWASTYGSNQAQVLLCDSFEFGALNEAAANPSVEEPV